MSSGREVIAAGRVGGDERFSPERVTPTSHFQAAFFFYLTRPTGVFTAWYVPHPLDDKALRYLASLRSIRSALGVERI